MATAKELRKEAKRMGIKGWEEMGREELKAAISSQNGESTGKTKKAKKASKAKAETPAKKTKSAKAKKGKAKATKSASSNGSNPFRAGTNLWHITEALMQGGKRSELVRKLRSKLEYNPRVQAEDDFDVDAETDRRLKVVGYILKNSHGWTYEHEGRGTDAHIKVTPP